MRAGGGHVRKEHATPHVGLSLPGPPPDPKQKGSDVLAPLGWQWARLADRRGHVAAHSPSVKCVRDGRRGSCMLVVVRRIAARVTGSTPKPCPRAH